MHAMRERGYRAMRYDETAKADAKRVQGFMETQVGTEAPVSSFRLVFSVAILGFTLMSPQACRRHQSIQEESFQKEVQQIVSERGLPGMTAAYGLEDGTVRVFAVGSADREERIPMRPNSRMLAASIGKTFTAATALALSAEGVLDLDAPIRQYIGDEKWLSRLPNGDTITTRHLLTHSSGIADHVKSAGFAREFLKQIRGERPPITPRELVSFVLDMPAHCKPGNGFYYSDTGYIIAGLIVEKAGGNDLYAQIRSRFLIPLGLSLTTPSDRKHLPGLASGYLSPDNVFGLPEKTTYRPEEMVWNPRVEWAGGGFVSNPRDLVLWTKALYEGRAIPGNYREALLQGVRVGPSVRYGLATVITENPGGTYASFGHKGWIPGYCSSIRYYTRHKAAVAFQINSDVGLRGRQDAIGEIESRLYRVLFDPARRRETP